jgi:Na+/H+ antiporter NhaD/arsenite permease-like protein
MAGASGLSFDGLALRRFARRSNNTSRKGSRVSLAKLGGLLCSALLLLVLNVTPALAEIDPAEEPLGARLPVVSILPFAAMLLAIAILPLAAGHWWEHNKNKGIVAAILGVPLAIYLVTSFGDHGVHALEHSGQEYISFIALLGSLFVISGGIQVKGSLSGTPLLNTGILAFGAVIASVIGTTGASMLLIRPLLRANEARTRKAHIVVFFIFIVSNCGGLLTPLGDPPLFLGFLKGVPFEWTFQLWREWAFVNGLLLVIFNVWDQVTLDREEKERAGSQLEAVMEHEPLRVHGLHNFLFLAGVVATIYASGRGLGNNGNSWPYGVQEGCMVALLLASYFTTSKAIHTSNRFTFGPIIEVAVLFAGIFVTMIPALQILNANGSELGVNEAWEYFWAAGALSSFLDNAPTYLTFAATACGMQGVPLEGRYLDTFLTLPGKEHLTAEILAAISCGAVFMGANTYIGNGPNFMVKAIAEENGVKMPSFFGYMAYSGAILIPLFVLVTFVFFL